MAQQRTVLFSGNVQGVGFRWTACRVAEGYDVTGTVQNRPDGQVECVVEGDREEVDAYLDALSERMCGHIRDRKQQTAPASGRYSGFRVKY